MAKQLKTGDKVEWNTSQGKTNGTVKKKLTSATKIKGHKVAASKHNPQYMVESSKSGEKAAHKAESLKKVSGTKKEASKSKTTSSGSKSTKTKPSTSKKKDPDDEHRAVIKDFKNVVNITRTKLEVWLKTPESKKVGHKDDGSGESVGHGSGRRIVKILQKKQTEMTKPDIAHMRKVVGYVNRHLAQRPKGDISESNWRYSLMNWGHDPAK